MGGETRVLHGASESLAEIFVARLSGSVSIWSQADAEHAAAAAFATAEP